MRFPDESQPIPQKIATIHLPGVEPSRGWRVDGPVLESNIMTLGTILLIILILILLGALPTWGYSRSWGYGPSGGVGLIVIILIILLLMGRI
jgi:hypothetical protein